MPNLHLLLEIEVVLGLDRNLVSLLSGFQLDERAHLLDLAAVRSIVHRSRCHRQARRSLASLLDALLGRGRCAQDFLTRDRRVFWHF